MLMWVYELERERKDVYKRQVSDTTCILSMLVGVAKLSAFNELLCWITKLTIFSMFIGCSTSFSLLPWQIDFTFIGYSTSFSLLPWQIDFSFIVVLLRFFFCCRDRFFPCFLITILYSNHHYFDHDFREISIWKF